MNKFSIDESPDIVVNLTFSTTVLTDGSGAEERNSNWQSPLLNFDLQKVILHKPQLDEIIQFFREARGAAISFRYRDWSDYLVTAQPRTTKYGSTTQGLLLPNADGVRNEFELVKRYIVPSCTHLRAIAFADPATVTLYDANFNPFPDTDWIFADGKFVFTTPPPAGQLFCEGEFDVPVVFASDENQYRIKSTKGGNTYSIEGLQLNEVRGQGSGARGSSFLTSDLTPLTSLKDDLGEIDTVFALSGHFNSLVGLREQTEIITLASGFDKRTSRFSKPKGTYFLGKIPLHDDELDYLIAFFRCTKGKGLSWAFEDVSYQQKNVTVRFDEDNLSLRLNRQGRYETDGLKAIEVFEPLPVALIDPFAVSTQEYLKFFTLNPIDPGNPSSPVSGYPAPPFYLVTLPYLSVFINSDNPKKLVSTYNGVQRIIGDISYFNDLGAVNLNYRGDGKFSGTALSFDRTKFIIFTDSGIGTVKNLNGNSELKLKGNIALKPGLDTFFILFSPSAPAPFSSPITSVTFNLDSGLNPFFRYTFTHPFVFVPSTRVLAFGDSFSFGYEDSRNVIGEKDSDYGVVGQSVANINYELDNGNQKLYIPNRGFSFTFNLGYTENEAVNYSLQSQCSRNLVATDTPSRKGTYQRQETYHKETNTNFVNTTTIRRGISQNEYDIDFVGMTGTLAQEQSITHTKLIDSVIPVVLSDHKTGDYIQKLIFSEELTLSSNGNYQRPESKWRIDSSVAQGSFDKSILKKKRSLEFDNSLVDSKFNVGDLGIYSVEKFHQIETINITRDRGKPLFDIGLYPINNTNGFIALVQSGALSQEFYSHNNCVAVSESTKSICSENSQIYKVVYLNNERTANRGYASNCSFDNKIIHNFYLDNGSPNVLNIVLSYQRILDWITSITKTDIKLDQPNSVVNSTFFTTRQPLDNKDIRNFDFQGSKIIVKTQYLGNIYLALCQVTSLVATNSGNQGSNSAGVNSQTINGLNCEIISVQKIKSFFTPNNFLFTVNGCEVFKFLDPYRTNLIKDQGKVYLAATMPPVTQDNTQTLVFQLVSDGLEFYGVFGGSVDSISSSPGADKWIKFHS